MGSTVTMEREIEELKACRKYIRNLIGNAQKNFQSVYEELLEHELSEVLDEIELRLNDLREMIKESQNESLNL